MISEENETNMIDWQRAKRAIVATPYSLSAAWGLLGHACEGVGGEATTPRPTGWAVTSSGGAATSCVGWARTIWSRWGRDLVRRPASQAAGGVM